MLRENEKPILLYISRAQFGYMVPTYNNCRYLRNHFNLRFVSLQQNRPQVDLPGVEIIYTPFRKKKFFRYFDLIKISITQARLASDIVLIEQFPGCFPIRLLGPKKTYILDIRTGGVSASRLHRLFTDFLIKVDITFFDHISVISAGLARKLGIKKKKFQVIPLGADDLNLPKKNFSENLHLLYVGALSGRKIEETIQGLFLFLKKNPGKKVLYEIVGDGLKGEREALTKLVKSLGLSEVVTLHGYIHQKDLLEKYSRCNVGVSYIPQTAYYDHQPPTKTFEYLLAGMPVLATSTTENKKVINETNGILIQDNPDSFSKGLAILSDRLPSFDSLKIRKNSLAYSWQFIINEIMVPYLKKLID